MDEKTSKIHHDWHVGINQAVDHLGYDKARFMYDAKEIAEESERLPYWFARERTGTLPKSHQQCSHSEPEVMADNHLTCCLGVECRKCEFLLSLDAHAQDIPPEEMDKIKTWTCISHIMRENAKGFVDTSEGMVLTTSDRLFWDGVYRSLAAGDDETE
jgi:hypothetical protein